jgi:response regulator RpfG family c-di-GMP phosphodiesterase
MGFPERGQEQLLFAGLIHDSGAFSLKERLEALEFEFSNLHYHAFVAHLLFKEFSFLPEISRILLFHHLPWEGGKGSYWQGDRVPLESHVLHFADRLSILFKADNEPLEEVRRVGEILREHVPEIFHPEVFEAFSSLLARDYVWFDFSSRDLHRIILENASPQKKCVNPSDFLALVKLVSHLIDFRSPFTVTHSAGVAQVALFLSKLVGLEKNKRFLFFGITFLHDLGKLAIPLEILEKAGPLTQKEHNIVRSHPYYTYRALASVPSLRVPARWAAEHHERLNGGGYPFGLKGEEISLESRIVAVADVFVALCEDRPYRKGLSRAEVKEILGRLASEGNLDESLISLLFENLDEIDETRKIAQEEAVREYQMFRSRLKDFRNKFFPK